MTEVTADPAPSPAPRPSWWTRAGLFAGRHERLLWSIYVGLLLWLYLLTCMGTPMCFDDCRSYLVLTDQPSFDAYLDAARRMWRPWFVPVFFSLFGKYSLSHAQSIVITQSLLLFGAWLTFAWTIGGLFGGKASRVAFVALSSMAFAQQHAYLNRFLISDASSLATLLWFLSATIAAPRLSRAMNPTAALLLITLLAACTAGARDSNVMFVFAGAVYLVFVHRAKLSSAWRLVAFGCLLAVATAQTFQGADRHRIHMRNILAGFVLPRPEVRDFFEQHGAALPCKDCAPNYFEWSEATPALLNANIISAGMQYRGPSGMSRIWLLWLVRHPARVASMIRRDFDLIFAQSFVESGAWQGAIGEDASVETFPNKLVPVTRPNPVRWTPSEWLGARARLCVLALALGVLALQRRRCGDLFPAALLIGGIGTANAVGAYFGDLWQPSELMRHAFIGSVLSHTGTVLAVLAVGTLLARRWRDDLGRGESGDAPPTEAASAT